MTPLAAIRGYTETLGDAGDLRSRSQHAAALSRHRRGRRRRNSKRSSATCSIWRVSKAAAARWSLERRAGRGISSAASSIVTSSHPRTRHRRSTLSDRSARPAVRGRRRAGSNRRCRTSPPTRCGTRLTAAVWRCRASPRRRIGSRRHRARHGPGIPPNTCPRIFDRFYKVDASRRLARSVPSGSGLGLSIVRRSSSATAAPSSPGTRRRAGRNLK